MLFLSRKPVPTPHRAAPALDEHERHLWYRRRLDWRFLLPNPEPQRVAFIGAPASPLLAALRATCPDVRLLDAEGPPRAVDADLVVVQHVLPSAAATAWAALAPGGSLYWEIGRHAGAPRRRAVPRSPWEEARRVSRHLAALGCGDVAVQWHRPDFDACLEIIPMQVPGVLDWALRRPAGTRSAGMKRMVARALRRAGLLPHVVSCLGLVARKSETPARARHPVADFLLANRGCLPARLASRPLQLDCLLRTPRFHTSSHVLFFVFAAGESEPCLVVKTPRFAEEHRFLDREADHLRAVQSARSGGFDSIPRLVSYEEWHGRRLLVQSPVAGRTMSPAYVRRHTHECLESLLAWLLELHATTRAPAADDDPAAPLRRLETLFAPASAPVQMAQRTRALLAAWPLTGVPRVFEHGDLGSPNLLVDARGRLGVVDWELAEPSGLPAADLFFFLNFVAGARAGARRPEDVVRAFHGAFFGARAWARPYVERYAATLQLPGGALRSLFLLTWARTAVNVALRMHADREATDHAGPPLSSQALESDRSFAVWRHALEHAAELEF